MGREQESIWGRVPSPCVTLSRGLFLRCRLFSTKGESFQRKEASPGVIESRSGEITEGLGLQVEPMGQSVVASWS